jgi:hypothetical protein
MEFGVINSELLKYLMQIQNCFTELSLRIRWGYIFVIKYERDKISGPLVDVNLHPFLVSAIEEGKQPIPCFGCFI